MTQHRVPFQSRPVSEEELKARLHPDRLRRAMLALYSMDFGNELTAVDLESWREILQTTLAALTWVRGAQLTAALKANTDLSKGST